MSRRHSRTPVQLSLNFAQIPLPLEAVWQQISEEDRAAALEVLGKLLAKATMGEVRQEEEHD